MDTQFDDLLNGPSMEKLMSKYKILRDCESSDSIMSMDLILSEYEDACKCGHQFQSCDIVMKLVPHSHKTRELIMIYNNRFHVLYDSQPENIDMFIERLSEYPGNYIFIESEYSNEKYTDLIRKLIENLPKQVLQVEIDCLLTIEEIGEELIEDAIKYSSMTRFFNQIKDSWSAMGGFEELSDHMKKLLDTPLDERPIRSKTKSAMKR